MPTPPTHVPRIVDGSRERIVQMLRSGALTVNDLAAHLGLSHNAIRVQLTSLERDGIVQHAGTERRTTRPSHVFELTPEARESFSKAYVPFLSHLVGVLTRREPPAAVATVMREVGKSLADALRGRAVLDGPLADRVAAASLTLNEELGAVTHVEPVNAHFMIRGSSCPLAALTSGHPAVCLAVERLVAGLTNSHVRECCRRDENPPRCCLEIRPHKK